MLFDIYSVLNDIYIEKYTEKVKLITIYVYHVLC